MELLESITNDRQLLRDLENKSLGLLQKSEGLGHVSYNVLNIAGVSRILCEYIEDIKQPSI